MDWSQAFRAFFGLYPDQLCTRVILTNIEPIFCGIKESAGILFSYSSGFYRGCRLRFSDGEDFDLFKIPPGNSVIDVLKLLTKYSREIVFLGIAGSLRDNYHLGDVCTVQSFTRPGEHTLGPGPIICQTSGLIQEDTFYCQLKAEGVDLVDMECFDVFSICRDNNVALRYVVQISDCPLEIPFYQASAQAIRSKTFLKEMGIVIE